MTAFQSSASLPGAEFLLMLGWLTVFALAFCVLRYWRKSQLMKTDNQQTGKTSQQMKHAAKGAVYIWPNSFMDYPKDLAKFLGRTDLDITFPSVFLNKYRGKKISGVVVDHATQLSQEQREFLRYLND